MSEKYCLLARLYHWDINKEDPPTSGAKTLIQSFRSSCSMKPRSKKTKSPPVCDQEKYCEFVPVSAERNFISSQTSSNSNFVATLQWILPGKRGLKTSIRAEQEKISRILPHYLGFIPQVTSKIMEKFLLAQLRIGFHVGDWGNQYFGVSFSLHSDLCLIWSIRSHLVSISLLL